MLRYSRRFISSDGFNVSARNHYLQLGFNSYFVSLFGRPDTFDVEYTDGNEIKHARYAAFKPKTIPSLPLGPRDDSLFVIHKKAGMQYRFLDGKKKTMLLRIHRFTNMRDKRAYKRIFRKLEKNRSENLVLDLRNNGGGSLPNTYRLLSYLIDSSTTQTMRTNIRNYPYREYTRGNVWFRFTRFAYRVIGEKRSVNDTDNFIYTIKPRKRHHFDGKILVLINGGSFSASSLVAAYLKSTGRATFIGEETGGTLEGCNAGITPYYKLPNTKLRVRMPAFRIIHDVSPQITGKGVLPDHSVEYTFRDIVGKRDLELQKAKELLKIP
jgi:C-terminal processing protease CtpA/Prc